MTEEKFNCTLLLHCMPGMSQPLKQYTLCMLCDRSRICLCCCLRRSRQGMWWCRFLRVSSSWWHRCRCPRQRFLYRSSRCWWCQSWSIRRCRWCFRRRIPRFRFDNHRHVLVCRWICRSRQWFWWSRLGLR